VRRGRAAVVAAALGIAVVAVGHAIDALTAGASAVPVRGPGLVTLRVDIHHSHFRVPDVRLRQGSLVRFVVRNHDPIDHEFVVGGPAVHARHEHGTEATHPPVPGEVSVGALDVGETVYRFDRPGRVVYACHLPGHIAYGMIGELSVVR